MQSIIIREKNLKYIPNSKVATITINEDTAQTLNTAIEKLQTFIPSLTSTSLDSILNHQGILQTETSHMDDVIAQSKQSLLQALDDLIIVRQNEKEL